MKSPRKKAHGKTSSLGQAERRKSIRRPILGTFSIFLVVPSKGVYRLAIHDVSEMGIGFDLDIDGESQTEFPAKPGDRLECQFYLNHSLFIPLAIQLVRIEYFENKRHVGAIFLDKFDPEYKAFCAFLKFLDGIMEVIQVKNPSEST